MVQWELRVAQAYLGGPVLWDYVALKALQVYLDCLEHQAWLVPEVCLIVKRMLLLYEY